MDNPNKIYVGFSLEPGTVIRLIFSLAAFFSLLIMGVLWSL